MPPAPDSLNPVRPLRILLVDDEPEILEILGDELTDYGHHTTLAHSGDEAYALVQSQSYDLIISDIQMSPGDGTSLLKRVRSDHPTQPILVFMSGHSQLSMQDAIRLGAEGILEKPFDRKKLHGFLALITERLQRTNQRRFDRIEVDLPILIAIKNYSLALEGKVKNISKAGVYIQVPEGVLNQAQVQRMDDVTYEVKTSTDPSAAAIRGQGQVRWIQSDSGFGIEFTRIENDSLPMLYDYLDRLMGTLLKPLED
jgi:CheY-like chemotaxis protein